MFSLTKETGSRQEAYSHEWLFLLQANKTEYTTKHGKQCKTVFSDQNDNKVKPVGC